MRAFVQARNASARAPSWYICHLSQRRKQITMQPRIVALLLGLLFADAASATTISFVVTDLADTTSGQDLWQYEYTVGGRTFDAGFGFSVGFDFEFYTALENPPQQVSADWDIIALQPDLNLPDFGLYDALAIADSASLTQPFVVTFVWLGQGTPGAQPFVVYDPSFATIETGTTVPEPSTPVLMLLAAALPVGTRRVAKRHRREHNNSV